MVINEKAIDNFYIAEEEISKNMEKARIALERCERCKYQNMCKSGEICVFTVRGKLKEKTLQKLIAAQKINKFKRWCQ